MGSYKCTIRGSFIQGSQAQPVILQSALRRITLENQEEGVWESGSTSLSWSRIYSDWKGFSYTRLQEIVRTCGTEIEGNPFSNSLLLYFLYCLLCLLLLSQGLLQQDRVHW